MSSEPIIDERLYEYFRESDPDYDFIDGDEIWTDSEGWYNPSANCCASLDSCLIRRKRKNPLPKQGEAIEVGNSSDDIRGLKAEFVSLYKDKVVVYGAGNFSSWKYWKPLPKKSTVKEKIEEMEHTLKGIERSELLSDFLAKTDRMKDQLSELKAELEGKDE